MEMGVLLKFSASHQRGKTQEAMAPGEVKSKGTDSPEAVVINGDSGESENLWTRSSRSETRKSRWPEMCKHQAEPRAFTQPGTFCRGLRPWVSKWKGPTVASRQLGQYVP